MNLLGIVGRIAALVALWLLAWGEITLANVISGVIVSSVLLIAFPPLHPTGPRVRVRPLGALRLVAFVAGQLVASNVVMARVVLGPRPALHPGVLAHHLERPSDELVTVMTSVLALSPGVFTVDVAADASTIYVHCLILKDVDEVRTSLVRLERIAEGALSFSAARPATLPREAP